MKFSGCRYKRAGETDSRSSLPRGEAILLQLLLLLHYRSSLPSGEIPLQKKLLQELTPRRGDYTTTTTEYYRRRILSGEAILEVTTTEISIYYRIIQTTRLLKNISTQHTIKTELLNELYDTKLLTLNHRVNYLKRCCCALDEIGCTQLGAPRLLEILEVYTNNLLSRRLSLRG